MLQLYTIYVRINHLHSYGEVGYKLTQNNVYLVVLFQLSEKGVALHRATMAAPLVSGLLHDQFSAGIAGPSTRVACQS